jgi:hypothetical protein
MLTLVFLPTLYYTVFARQGASPAGPTAGPADS